MTDAPKKPPYANSIEAYKAVHMFCSFSVESCLEDGDEEHALRYAAIMMEVEGILLGKVDVHAVPPIPFVIDEE